MIWYSLEVGISRSQIKIKENDSFFNNCGQNKQKNKLDFITLLELQNQLSIKSHDEARDTDNSVTTEFCPVEKENHFALTQSCLF